MNKNLIAFCILVLQTLMLVESKIVYITSLYRHGARYPVGDIYDGKQTKPFHGLLTTVGLRQHYNLGSYMKKQYIDNLKLVNASINPKQVDIISTTSLRCVLSAYAQAAGLFPVYAGERIPQEISEQFLQPPFQTDSQDSNLQTVEVNQGEYALNKGFQPVPIYVNNDLFPSCPNQAKITAKRILQIAPIVAQTQIQQAEFIARITKMFNLSAELSNLAGMIQLYDVVVCDLNLGRAMPKGFTQADFNHLQYLQHFFFALLNGGQYDKIWSTPILGAMLNNMDAVIGGKLAKKMTLLSGHDTNVAPLLTFLNLTTYGCIRKKFNNVTVDQNCAQPVPFASGLVIELHQRQAQLEESDPANYFVRVRYNGEYYRLCQSKQTSCAYTEFAKRVRHSLVDFNKECATK